MNQKIPALDGVRGIAILLVMLSHFVFIGVWPNNSWYRVLQSGWLGVDLFFVLSGFLITGILLRSREKPGYFSHFYRRRTLRIFPLYFFAIFIVWCCVVWVERAPERLQGYDSWWWYVFFASNIAMAFKDNWTYHSHFLDANHLWSIAVEEQFYLIWPLVVRFLSPKWLLLLCALIVYFSVDLRYLTDEQFGHDWSLASYMLPYCRMDGLAAGGFLAVFLHLGWHRPIIGGDWKMPGERFFGQQLTAILPLLYRWMARILIVWMGWRVLESFLGNNTQYLGTISALMFVSVLFLALNDHPRALMRRICEHATLRHLGQYSYGLYVFHHLPRSLYDKVFAQPLLDCGINPMVAQILYALLAFACTYGLARLSWRYIEKPFLDMK